VEGEIGQEEEEEYGEEEEEATWGDYLDFEVLEKLSN